VSLISDAGTPTISDPGNVLIKECVNNKINLIPIPGPSAPIAALSISGFSNKYYFYGFFPEKNSEINENFEILSKISGSIVFFISAKKFNRSISVIKKYFSDRKVLICKEITKYFEEYFRFDVSELDQKNISLKGEITLVLSEKKIVNKTSNNLNESDKRKIRKIVKKLSIKEIVDLIKDGRNIPKKEIYNYCLKIKNEK
jgi:16S rRNA (cytidine1402-2'-O)-methyltransferase